MAFRLEQSGYSDKERRFIPMLSFKNIRYAAIIFLICAGFFWASYTPCAIASEKPVVIKFAHEAGTTHQLHLAAEKFKDYVEKESNGRLKINIYPAAQLGRGKELAEGLLSGSIEMINTALYALIFLGVTDLGVLEMPYLFRNRYHAYKVLDGETLSSIHKQLEDKGVKIVDYFEIGLRHVTNNKRPIHTPEDLKGLKLRVQPMKMWLEFAKALGAIGTPVSFSDLYTSLQQGVVDGQENPIATIKVTKVYEVQKHLSLTAHSYTPAPVSIGTKFFNKLSPDFQNIIEDGAHMAAAWERQYLIDKEKEDLDFLKRQGVLVVEKPNIGAFINATMPLYNIMGYSPKFVKKIKDVR
jgi:tripartite ATP-independent transporter DctP family solute receptor